MALLLDDIIEAREQIAELVIPSVAERFVFINSDDELTRSYFMIKNLRTFVEKLPQRVS
jgi:hypothetical protein